MGCRDKSKMGAGNEHRRTTGQLVRYEDSFSAMSRCKNRFNRFNVCHCSLEFMDKFRMADGKKG